MMEASRHPAKESFIADLNELKHRAGEPSLGQLVKYSGHNFSKGTLGGHLSGQRAGLPRWRLVSAYVDACHAAAQSTGIDRKTLGTRRQWYARWDAASRGLPDPPNPFEEDVTEPLDDSDPSRSLASSGHRDQPEPRLGRLLEDILITQKTLSADAALLVVISGPNFAHRYELTRDVTTVGRRAESDIRLSGARVSRRHAEIYRLGDRFAIKDQDSTNGTFYENRRIFKETTLLPYDELRIGSIGLVFVQGGDDIRGLQAIRYRALRARLIRDSDPNTS
jgi:pSer/pThr/pTyr-binding forkhead associated (FHA) protein